MRKHLDPRLLPRPSNLAAMFCAAFLWIPLWGAAEDVPPEGPYFEWLKQKVPFYAVATGRFAPIYEPLARQMVLDYHLDRGIALDVGGNIGAFAMELAKKTQMTVYNLDIDPWAIRLCAYLVDRAGLTGRVIPVEGDALDMPFKDNFADFVFSRGSIPFWSDQAKGLKECYRVLKPGGVAYVGGGFGRLLDPQIRAELVRWRLEQLQRSRPQGWRDFGEHLPELARQAGIPDDKFRYIKEPDIGWWLEIRK